MADKFDESVPPDSEKAGLGAQRIREFKAALNALLTIDHDKTDGASMGFHHQVTIPNVDTPSGTGVADAVILFSKDDSDNVAQLFVIDENDNEIQLTSGGILTGDIVKGDDATVRSFTTTSFVDDTNLDLDMTVVEGDVVKVTLMGKVYVGAPNSSTAYLQTIDDNSKCQNYYFHGTLAFRSDFPYFNTFGVGTQSVTPGDYFAYTQYFRCTSAGTAKFRVQGRLGGGAGSINVLERYMVAEKIYNTA